MKQKQTHVSHTDVLWNGYVGTHNAHLAIVCVSISWMSVLFSNCQKFIESICDVRESLADEWLPYLFHESFYAHRCNVHSKCTLRVTRINLSQKQITLTRNFYCCETEKALNDYPEQVDAWWKSPLCAFFWLLPEVAACSSWRVTFGNGTASLCWVKSLVLPLWISLLAPLSWREQDAGQLVLIWRSCRDLCVHCYDTSRAKVSCGKRFHQSHPSIVPTGDLTLHLYLVPSLQFVAVQIVLLMLVSLGRINQIFLQRPCRNNSSLGSCQPQCAPLLGWQISHIARAPPLLANQPAKHVLP